MKAREFTKELTTESKPNIKKDIKIFEDLESKISFSNNGYKSEKLKSTRADELKQFLLLVAVTVLGACSGGGGEEQKAVSEPVKAESTEKPKDLGDGLQAIPEKNLKTSIPGSTTQTEAPAPSSSELPAKQEAQKQEELVLARPGSEEFQSALAVVDSRIKKTALIGDEITVVNPIELPSEKKLSLLLAFPLKMLGEQFLFGGVATRIGNKTEESLGMLKLLELTPLHVRPILTGTDTQTPQFSLMGCVENCQETSKSSDLLDIPVRGIDVINQTVIIDLSAIGQKLNLIQIFDPFGAETQLKPRISYTNLMDYSRSTLVFDVESEMIPVASDVNDPGATVTAMTFRWYLKPASGFDPAFVQRNPVKEVGFFTTERSKETRITRWNLGGGEASIHYYIKNVPSEYIDSFKEALDEWNRKLSPSLDKNLISYEFVDVGDARYPNIVAGDVRYSVIEWDLDNKAPYGGFGPSIANQYTGEIFAAYTLIQGPSIIRIYKDWFKVSEQVLQLNALGMTSKAALAIKDFRKRHGLDQELPKAEVRMGRHKFKIGSLLPSLQDERMARNDFDLVPDGQDFDSYMKGYFVEMVSHEVGHNLGLRHNFRGNLADDGSHSVGSTSRSIMEYLGRRYRHLNRIQKYDLMAMEYGYRGVLPKEGDWYCTDEDVIVAKNMHRSGPECSRDDATSDPYSYFERRLSQSIDYLINRGSPQAPNWSVLEMQKQLGESILGLAFYSATAERMSTWTNFANAGRPSDVSGVKAYVLETFKSRLCDPSIYEEVALKESEEAMKKTIENVATLRAVTETALTYLRLYTPEQLACGTVTP